MGYGASWEELVPQQPASIMPSTWHTAGGTAWQGTESPGDIRGTGEGQGCGGREGEQAAAALLSGAVRGEATLAAS